MRPCLRLRCSHRPVHSELDPQVLEHDQALLEKGDRKRFDHRPQLERFRGPDALKLDFASPCQREERRAPMVGVWHTAQEASLDQRVDGTLNRLTLEDQRAREEGHGDRPNLLHEVQDLPRARVDRLGDVLALEPPLQSALQGPHQSQDRERGADVGCVGAALHHSRLRDGALGVNGSDARRFTRRWSFSACHPAIQPCHMADLTGRSVETTHPGSRDRVVTRAGVAHLLGCSISTVRRLEDSRALPYVVGPFRVRQFDVADVMRLKKSRARASGPGPIRVPEWASDRRTKGEIAAELFHALSVNSLLDLRALVIHLRVAPELIYELYEAWKWNALDPLQRARMRASEDEELGQLREDLGLVGKAMSERGRSARRSDPG